MDRPILVTMERYRDQSGKSGVLSYEIRAESIVVRFKHGGTYVYDRQRPGAHHVESMKALAIAGAGLATYINRHVREDYADEMD